MTSRRHSSDAILVANSSDVSDDFSGGMTSFQPSGNDGDSLQVSVMNGSAGSISAASGLSDGSTGRTGSNPIHISNESLESRESGYSSSESAGEDRPAEDYFVNTGTMEKASTSSLHSPRVLNSLMQVGCKWSRCLNGGLGGGGGRGVVCLFVFWLVLFFFFFF